MAKTNKLTLVQADETDGIYVPEGLKTPGERKAFAADVCREIQASIDSYSGLDARVTRNEQLYRNQDGITAVDMGPDAPPARHVPIVQPKVDATIGDIYLAMTGLNPYVQAIPMNDNQPGADRVQADLQFLAEKGKFDMAFWLWVKYALIGGMGVLRVSYVEHDTSDLTTMSGQVHTMAPGEKIGAFQFDVVHMSDYIAYPHSMGRVQRLKTSGNRMAPMRVQEVREMQESGEWIGDGEIYGNDTLSDIYPHGRDRFYDLTQSFYSIDPADKEVNVYEVIRKHRFEGMAREQYFKCIVDKDRQVLLHIEPYTYTEPWHKILRFDVEQGSIWPSGSFAQNLQAIQLNLNDDVNIMALGNRMAAVGIILVPSGAMGQQVTPINAGNIQEMNGDPGQVKVVHMPFNAGQMQWLIEYWEDKADAISRKSQMATGEQLKSGATATEANRLAAADMAAQSQFIRFASEAMEDLWNFMFQLYRLHRKSLRRSYLGALKATDDDLDKQIYRFEVNGKSAGNSAALLQQKLMQMMGWAMQPMSQFDYQKTEMAAAEALQLPFNPKGLVKDAEGQAQAFLADPKNIQALLQNPMIQEQIMGMVQQGAQQMAPAIAQQMVEDGIKHAAWQLSDGMGAAGDQPGMAGGSSAPPFAPGSGGDGTNQMSA